MRRYYRGKMAATEISGAIILKRYYRGKMAATEMMVAAVTEMGMVPQF